MNELQDGYTSRLLLAMFVVVVIPFVFSKIMPMINIGKEKKYDLNSLIRQELLKLGKYFSGTTSSQPSQNSKTRKLNFSQVITEYRKSLEAFRNEGKHNYVKDIESSLELFEATERNDSSKFKSIEQAILNITKSSVPLRDIINSSKELLRNKAFLSLENEPLTFREVKNIIESRSILKAFLEDSVRQSSTVSSVIEKSKKKKPEDVYIATALMILCKCGGSEKRLYEQAMINPRNLYIKLKQMPSHQIDKALMNIIRNGHSFIQAKQVLELIKQELKKVDHFRAKYNSEKREQQKKRSEKTNSQKNNHKYATNSSTTVDSAYTVLGCSKADSTTVIKKQYRKLVMQYHPDRVSSDDELEIVRAKEKFVEIQNAYEKIKNNRKKAA